MFLFVRPKPGAQPQTIGDEIYHVGVGIVGAVTVEREAHYSPDRTS